MGKREKRQTRQVGILIPEELFDWYDKIPTRSKSTEIVEAIRWYKTHKQTGLDSTDIAIVSQYMQESTQRIEALEHEVLLHRKHIAFILEALDAYQEGSPTESGENEEPHVPEES